MRRRGFQGSGFGGSTAVTDTWVQRSIRRKEYEFAL
jgi:hypothetical protein